MFLTDDNAFITSQRVEEIARVITDSGVNMFWAGFLRADSINAHNIRLLKNSGLIGAILGV